MNDIEDTIFYWREERVTTNEVLASMGSKASGKSWEHIRAMLESRKRWGDYKMHTALLLVTERELTGI